MKTKFKIVIVLLNIFLLSKVIVFLNSNNKSIKVETKNRELELIDVQTRFNLTPPHLLPETEIRDNAKYPKDTENCTIETCFNRNKCNPDNFKIYIYKEPKRVLTEIYQKILNSIHYSNYYTENSDEACLFMLQIDAIDRDRLSKNYDKEIDKHIQSLAMWNNGENHLIYNLYAGTWSRYLDDLNFNFGKAILLETSISYKFYRPDYDVAMPLFNQNLGDSEDRNTTHILEEPPIIDDSKKKYFLTFKGKRYLIGIGTKARNALYHLNNGRDIFLLTTCIHPSTDKSLIEDDKRCAEDNLLYDK